MHWFQGYYSSVGNPFAFAFLVPVFLLVVIWSLVWKGLALWKAAKSNDRNWFIALLIINSLGLLEILYIYFFSKNRHRE